MRPKAFCLINNLSTEFKNPEWAFEAMRAYLKSVLAHAKASMARNLVEKYFKHGIYFNDVESVVKSVEYKLKCETKKEKHCNDLKSSIIKTKIEDSRGQVSITKKKMNICKNNLDKVVRRHTIARDYFMEVVAEESEYFWVSESKRNNQKFRKALTKKHENVLPHYQLPGVLISDNDLEKYRENNA